MGLANWVWRFYSKLVKLRMLLHKRCLLLIFRLRRCQPSPLSNRCLIHLRVKHSIDTRSLLVIDCWSSQELARLLCRSNTSSCIIVLRTKSLIHLLGLGNFKSTSLIRLIINDTALSLTYLVFELLSHDRRESIPLPHCTTIISLNELQPIILSSQTLPLLSESKSRTPRSSLSNLFIKSCVVLFIHSLSSLHSCVAGSAFNRPHALTWAEPTGLWNSILFE